MRMGAPYTTLTSSSNTAPQFLTFPNVFLTPINRVWHAFCYGAHLHLFNIPVNKSKFTNLNLQI